MYNKGRKLTKKIGLLAKGIKKTAETSFRCFKPLTYVR